MIRGSRVEAGHARAERNRGKAAIGDSLRRRRFAVGDRRPVFKVGDRGRSGWVHRPAERGGCRQHRRCGNRGGDRILEARSGRHEGRAVHQRCCKSIRTAVRRRIIGDHIELVVSNQTRLGAEKPPLKAALNVRGASGHVPDPHLVELALIIAVTNRLGRAAEIRAGMDKRFCARQTRAHQSSIHIQLRLAIDINQRHVRPV